VGTFYRSDLYSLGMVHERSRNLRHELFYSEFLAWQIACLRKP